MARAPSVAKNHNEESSKEDEEDEASYIQPRGRRPAIKRSQTVMGRGNRNEGLSDKKMSKGGTRKALHSEEEGNTEDEEERNEAENSEEDARTA